MIIYVPKPVNVRIVGFSGPSLSLSLLLRSLRMLLLWLLWRRRRCLHDDERSQRGWADNLVDDGARQCRWGGSALFGYDVEIDLVMNQLYIASVRMALISFQSHHRPTEMSSPLNAVAEIAPIWLAIDLDMEVKNAGVGLMIPYFTLVSLVIRSDTV